jgi:hypothetical protein
MSRPAPFLFAAICAALLTAPAPAQALPSREPLPWKYGTHAFRWTLNNLGFQPLQSLDECAAEPERTLIIVLGKTWPLDHVPGGVRHFVEQGGAVLIATDQTRSAFDRSRVGSWERTFAVEVKDSPVWAVDTGTAIAYRRLFECPMVRAVDNKDSPLFLDLRQGVATNCPGSLEVRRSGTGAALVPLAYYPPGCRSQDDLRYGLRRRLPSGDPFGHDPERLPGNAPSAGLLFAAGGDWGGGRVLVLADHSVFINEMMLQTDNENIPFACNCMQWLGEGRRDRVLFCEEGTINANFNVPVVEPPLPPPGPWINHLVQGMEDENRFNRAILRQFTPGQIFRALLLALTGLLVLYGLVCLVKLRSRVEPAAPPLAQAVNRQLALQAVLHQRHQDMLRADNLWEAARTLAQQCFEPVAVPRERPPRLRVAGGWWQRRRLGRQVRRLWRLAFGPAPVRVSAHEFVDLVREMEAVQAALAKGIVVIGV